MSETKYEITVGWIPALLVAALFFCKVTHIYDMSWWVVFSPVLAALLIGLLAVGLMFFLDQLR